VAKSTRTMWDDREPPPVGGISEQPAETTFIQPTPPKDRLTVVGSVYHQNPGSPPTQIEIQYSRELASHEEPYARRIVVSSRQLVDFGWLKEEGVGAFVLANLEGQFDTVEPTPEQSRATAARIVRVYASEQDKNPQILRPGESRLYEFLDARAVEVVCESEEARCKLTAYPR